MSDRNPKRERGLSPSLTFRVMIGRKTTYDSSCNFLLRFGLRYHTGIISSANFNLTQLRNVKKRTRSFE
jgi:hypothetical protein